MAYLDYVGLAYFKSLLDENYLRTDYSGDTTIQGNVTFTEPVDADVKNDYLGNQIDKTYIKDITLDPEGSGALALVLGDGSVSHLLTNTTVSQVRSSANELYPVLLCYDANAEEDQITKTVKYVHDVQINPSTGYISAKGVYVKHPTFNRRNGVSQKVEWAYDFTDGVSGLGNPMSQVYAYVDPASQGGEHCIELRLYGNPNVSPTVPSINDSTNTFSIGVGVTGGNVRFGYCPSTPLYLDNGSTLRTEATGHGTDIITRDWLNLNGSLTGLVHTTMNETIDGAKTFKKTVTINSGDNSNKAGLYVQGNSDVHGNEHVYGTETVDGKLTANGTAEIKGGSGNTPSLTVTGSEYVSGNSNIHGNMDVDGNSNTDGNQTIGGTSTITGKLTANGTAEIKGGSGNNPSLTVTGNETVTGNSSVGGNSSVAGNETVTGKITGNGGAEISGGSGLKVNGNETVTGNISATGNIITNGTITKVVNNTPVEYVTYVTNQPEVREALSDNILALGRGLNKDSTGKIYVDFSQIDTNTKAAILAGLDMQIPLKSNIELIVNPGASNDTDSFSLDYNTRVSTPFTTIQSAITWASSKLALGTKRVTIRVYTGVYEESISLPEVNASSGYISIESYSGNKDVTIKPPVTDGSNNGIVASSGACAWTLKHLKVELHCKPLTSGSNYAYCAIGSHVDGAIVSIHGCDCSVIPDTNNMTGNMYSIRIIDADSGGRIKWYPDDKGQSLTFNLPTTNTADVHIDVINVCRSGRISFMKTTTTNNGTVSCSGSCTRFIYAWADGGTNNIGATGVALAFSGNVTGVPYRITDGSFVIAPAGGFPGDGTPVIDSSTYCWGSNLE